MGSRGKQDTEGYQQLKQDLEESSPRQLYVFYGEEDYLRDHYLNRLKQCLLQRGLAEFNLHELQGKEMSPGRLEQILDCLPVQSDRTLVLVYDYDFWKAGEEDRKAYQALLADLPEYVCLVFLYDLIPFKGDARTKLGAMLREKKALVHFARQEQAPLVQWVRRRFRALGKEIDSRLALDLIFLCGDLMTNLTGEIEKIGAYAQGDRITLEDIEGVATPHLDAVVFRMTDAIGEGKFEQAVSVLGQLNQMQESPVKLMWSLSRHMRQIYSARLVLEYHGSREELMNLWKLKPYPMEKLFRSARRFSLSWCRSAVRRCCELELRMRSTSQSGSGLLTQLLLELAISAQGSHGAGGRYDQNSRGYCGGRPL